MRLLSNWQETAAGQKIGIVSMPAVGPSDLEKAITDAMDAKAEIAIGLLGADTYAMRKEIAEAASAHRFPIAMDTPGGYIQMGGQPSLAPRRSQFFENGMRNDGRPHRFMMGQQARARSLIMIYARHFNSNRGSRRLWRYTLPNRLIPLPVPKIDAERQSTSPSITVAFFV